MDAKGVRNILVIFNKHNTARVASCWFIIYYGLVMHGNSNIKKKVLLNVRNVFNRHKSVQLKSLKKLQNLELCTY